jgi:hypothetical protein
MNRLRRAQSEFAIIPNKAMRDKRLSAEARGLLGYLMTHSDNWEFNFEVVRKAMGGGTVKSEAIGREKLQRMIRELIEAGYLKRTPRRIDGVMRGQDWEIVDDPESPISRVSENPTVGRPGTHLEDQPSKKIKRKEDQSLMGSSKKRPDEEEFARRRASPLVAEVAEYAMKRVVQ